MLPKRRKPTHPGVILDEEFLKPLMISPKQLADKMGAPWSELKITALIKGKEPISDKTAKDLEKALETPSQFWLRLQQQYSQWEESEKQNEKGSIKPWKKAQ
jgi:addiction module HigA family antidote